MGSPGERGARYAQEEEGLFCGAGVTREDEATEAAGGPVL